MNRSRQLLMVAFVATALAADRAVAAAPQDRPSRSQTTATPNAARRLAGRLVVTFRQSVPSLPWRPFRQDVLKAQPQTFPTLLSQTGCVDASDPTRPASGLLAYDVVDPFWSDGAVKLRQRLAFLHANDPTWPDMSDEALANSLLSGLYDALGRIRSGRELRTLDVAAALLGQLDWEQRRRLDQLAPTHFEAPTGSRLPIDYADPRSPGVSVRLQELFGTRETPTVFGGRVALTLHLLSPAQRPVQVTRDLAGFWKTSYYDVRKDLRARYPKHSWPDDPLAAAPTRRAKPRE